MAYAFLSNSNTVQLAEAAAFLIVGLILSNVFANLAAEAARKKISKHMGMIVHKATLYPLIFIVFVGFLGILHIDLTAFFAAAGIIGIALGFAAQKSVSNIISGIFLLADKPFQVDDAVKIDDVRGKVLSINLLSTRLRTYDNLHIRIPNEDVASAKIINYTRYNKRRAEIQVNVEYRCDLNKVKKALIKAIEKHDRLVEGEGPQVLVRNLGRDGVELEVRVWVERKGFINTKSDLIQICKETLEKEKVDIPFPQRDVYLRASGPLSRILKR